MSEQDELPVEDQVIDEVFQAFETSIAGEKSEDEIKMCMIQSGATFKNVTRLYNQYMIDAGLAISREDRNGLIEGALTGLEFDTEELFSEASALIAEAIAGSTDRSADAIVRAYAKKNDLECYSKPKGAGGSRSGFASGFHAYIVENPLRDVADFEAFIDGSGDHAETSDNVKRSKSHYMGISELCRTIAENAKG